MRKKLTVRINDGAALESRARQLLDEEDSEPETETRAASTSRPRRTVRSPKASVPRTVQRPASPVFLRSNVTPRPLSPRVPAISPESFALAQTVSSDQAEVLLNDTLRKLKKEKRKIKEVASHVKAFEETENVERAQLAGYPS